MSKVTYVTREELLAQREDVLRDLGMTLEEFAELRSKYTLVGKEWHAAHDLDDIEFLLQGTDG